MDGRQRDDGQRFFKQGDQLRAALVDVYDKLSAELAATGPLAMYTAAESAAKWELRRHGLGLHEALDRLDATGAAPESIYTTLARGEDTLSFHAQWDGLEGHHLHVEYEGSDQATVLQFGAAIRRALSHHGREETYQPLDLGTGKPPRWFESQWFGAVVGALAGSVITYFLPKLFG